MKKYIQNIPGYFILHFFLLIPLLSGAQAAEIPTLENIEFTSTTPDVERIIFKLNGTYIPKIFAIKGKKPRVVFDFPETRTAKTLNNIITTNGTFIKQIRIGIHEGEAPKTRVVLDLIPDKKIDFNQEFDQQKNALTVSVYYAGSPPSRTEDSSTQPTVVAEPEQPEVQKPVPPTAETTQPPAVPEPTPRPAAVPEPTPQPAPGPETTPQPSEPALTPTSTQDAAPLAKQSEAKNELPVHQAKVGKNNTPTLRSVIFDNSSNRGEMIQFRLNDFYPPIVFGIEEGLPRVVCDFKDTHADDSIKETIKTDGRYVKSIRVGKHKNPNKIRVVIDLEPNNNYDLQQVFFKEDNLFVIIVNIMHNSPPVTELKKPIKQ